MRRLASLLAVLVLAAGLARGVQAQQPLQTYERSQLAIQTASGQTYLFTVELALTPPQQAQGLMYRQAMAPNAGMLFVFPRVQPLSFWMKNTLIPLDMLFLAEDGTIINIAENTTPLSLESVPSDAPGKAVLELNGGITAALGIRAGDRVVHELLPASLQPATAPAPGG